MARPITTGHGATLTMATSTFTAAIIQIGSFESARQVLDKTHLTSGAYRVKAPGDVVDLGEFVVDFFYDMDTQPPYTAASPETTTISAIDTSTGSVGANSAKVAGSAFVRSFTHPEFVTDQLQRAQMVVVWAGGPLTYTDET